MRWIISFDDMLIYNYSFEWCFISVHLISPTIGSISANTNELLISYTLFETKSFSSLIWKVPLQLNIIFGKTTCFFTFPIITSPLRNTKCFIRETIVYCCCSPVSPLMELMLIIYSNLNNQFQLKLTEKEEYKLVNMTHV